MSGDERRFLATHNALRGIAALAVFAYHLQLDPLHRLTLGSAGPLIERGYLWVDFFFLLSGYVLSMSYLDRLGRGRFTEARTFLRARFARIVPMHLAALALLVAFVLVLRPTQEGLGGARFWSFLDTPNSGYLALQAMLLQVWNYRAAVSWNVPSWSISAEMHVYLVLPMLAWVAARRPRLLTCVMVAMSALIYAYLLATRPTLDILDPLAILRCLAGFLLGAAIERWRRPCAAIFDRQASAFQLAAVTGLVTVLLTSRHDVLAIPFFALLVAATAGDCGLLAHILAPRGCQALGRISYSIYLLNFPVLLAGDAIWMRLLGGQTDKASLLLRAGWGFALSVALIGLALATFRAIENPARRILRPHSASRDYNPAIKAPALDPAP